MPLKSIFLAFPFFLLFCGGANEVNVSLSGPIALNDPNVQDLVVLIVNEPTEDGFLDQDANGIPDAFIFPSQCGLSKPALCGFPVDPANIILGNVPLNFQYEVQIELRDGAGTVLYSGSSIFSNTKGSSSVSVVLQ